MGIRNVSKKSESDNEYYANNINSLYHSTNLTLQVWDQQEKKRAETRKRVLEEITRLFRLLVVLDAGEDSADRVPGGGG